VQWPLRLIGAMPDLLFLGRHACNVCPDTRLSLRTYREAANLDEMTRRFNNRKNPFLFCDTMLRPIHSDNLEYKELMGQC
jgi:hypothetical protein